MMKQIIYITVFVLLASFASASIADLGDVRLGSCMPLVQTCTDCSYNNVSTVTLPSKSVHLLEKPMTRIGNNYNYTYCNTLQVGDYYVVGHGDTGGADTVWSYTFHVTTAGYEEGYGFDATTLYLILAVIVSLFLYAWVSRFFGAMMVFITGFGVLFKIPTSGWIGWIIAACGFIMILYSILTKSRRRLR